MAVTSGERPSTTARIADAALFVVIAGTVSVVAMQVVRGDWFPPDVSISQYGVGVHGWMLTMTLLLLAAACALSLVAARRLSQARTWAGTVAWSIWILALIVMGLVPTNEWPAPLTMTGQVHQAAAVLGLFFAPIGAVLMVRRAGRPSTSNRDRSEGGTGNRGRSDGGTSNVSVARTVVIGSAVLSWCFLALLLLTNIDIDITGLGYRRAWSLHQTLAVVADIVMIFGLIGYLRAVIGDDRTNNRPTSPSTSSAVHG